MKTILAFDTSTLTASVAVVGTDQTVSFDADVSSHSDDLIEVIGRALTQAGVALTDLDGIAVGAGPGSFTGLRIGMATAKGLCFARGLPLWPVSSLAALARDGFDTLSESSRSAVVVPVVDARRGEIFTCAYRLGDAGQLIGLIEEQVCAPERLSELLATIDPGQVFLIGDALARYADALADVGGQLADARTTPSGLSVARLAQSGRVEDSLRAGTPTYIRPSEAEIKFPDGNPGGTFSRKR